MRYLPLFAALAGSVFFLGGASAWAVDPPPDRRIDFTADVLPILRQNCLACHSESTAEAGVILESAEGIREAMTFADEPLIMPGDSAASWLYQIVSRAEEPVMPPEDNDVGAKPLTDEELETIKLWIEQGAEQGTAAGAVRVAWKPVPQQIRPVYSVAVTPDGRWAVAGRANSIEVYDVLRGQSAGRLSDPAITAQLEDAHTPAAHLDLVQSVAVSSDGRWIASGGYRTVKLWRRQDPHPVAWPSDSETPITSLAVDPEYGSVAVGRQDGTVQIHRPEGEAETAAAQQVRPADGREVRGLQFSSRGLLVLVDESEQLEVWTWDKALQNLPVESPLLDACWLGPDRLAAAGAAGDLHVWKLEVEDDELIRLEPVQNVADLDSPVIKLLPLDEQRLVVAHSDGRLLVLNIPGGSVEKQLRAESAARHLAASRDGKQLLVVDSQGVARIWGLDGSAEPQVFSGDYRLQVQLEEARLGQQLAERQQSNAEADLKETQTRLEEENKAREKAAMELDEAQKALAMRQEAADKLATEFGELEVRHKATTEKVAELMGLKEEHGTRLAEAEAQVAAAQQDLQQVTEQLEEWRHTLATAEGILAASDQLLQADKRDLSQILQLTARQLVQQLHQEESSRQQDLNTAQEKLGAAQQQQSELTAAGQELQASLDAQQQELESLQKSVDEKRGESEMARQQLAEAERAVELGSDALARSEQIIASVEGQVPGLEEAIAQAKARVEESNSLQDARQRQLEEASYLVHAAEDLGDGTAVLVDRQGVIRLARPADAQPVATIDLWKMSPGPVTLLPEGRLLIASGPTPFVVSLIPRWELAAVWGDPASEQPFVDRITALDFSPDSQFLAVAGGEPSRSGQLQVWHLGRQEKVHEFSDAHSDSILAVRFSPDGKYLASGGSDRFVRVFRLEDATVAAALEGHTHHVLSVDWQLDGRRLVSGSADQTVKIWDFLERRQMRTIEGFGKDVTAVRFIGASEDFFAACANQTVARCNVGGRRDVIGRSDDYLYCLAATAAGDRCVTGSHTGSVEVLNERGQSVVKFVSDAP